MRKEKNAWKQGKSGKEDQTNAVNSERRSSKCKNQKKTNSERDWAVTARKNAELSAWGDRGRNQDGDWFPYVVIYKREGRSSLPREKRWKDEEGVKRRRKKRQLVVETKSGNSRKGTQKKRQLCQSIKTGKLKQKIKGFWKQR